MRVGATLKLRKRKLIHKTQAKACGYYQLQKEKNILTLPKQKRRDKNDKKIMYYNGSGMYDYFHRASCTGS